MLLTGILGVSVLWSVDHFWRNTRLGVENTWKEVSIMVSQGTPSEVLSYLNKSISVCVCAFLFPPRISVSESCLMTLP